MFLLDQTIAHLANQQHQHEGFLSAARAAWGLKSNADGADRLVEVTDFGSNPGGLRMLQYVPPALSAAPALVVVLHGCAQTAAGYDHGAGWSALAERCGFALLLPEQKWESNPNGCFPWFATADAGRDRGEPLSIRQMVERMILDHGIDRRRVFITGLSAGGAMTSVMLAAYPDVFAGGAIIAGLPYGCATNQHEALDCMFRGRSRPASDWGDLVRAASAHQGPWPTVSVWHGGADTTVKPINADEIVKQWTDVHGLASVAPLEDEAEGYPHRVWRNPDGEAVVEAHVITGMGHGTPVDPGVGEMQGGTAAPFMLDVGIPSTYHIARFWGLTEDRPEAGTA